MMRTILTTLILLACVSAHAGPRMRIELTVPAIDAEPYHRPFVAVWLETPERRAVTTLAIWYNDETWLKDLRQWWRKAGRSAGDEIDAVTGATPRPARHTIVWDGKDHSGETVPPGDYLLNIEAAREEGGRSYIRREVTLGESKVLNLPGEIEIGEVKVTIR
jgi:hypothetical protein